jgi:hypothetical protein
MATEEGITVVKGLDRLLGISSAKKSYALAVRSGECTPEDLREQKVGGSPYQDGVLPSDEDYGGADEDGHHGELRH